MVPQTAQLSSAETSRKLRALLCIGCAVALFLGKRLYKGPGSGLVQSYLGNLSISFACYFLAGIAFEPIARQRLLAAASALLAVEAFELTGGFGVMSNTYDPWDLLANAAGIAAAVMLDVLVKTGRPAEKPG